MQQLKQKKLAFKDEDTIRSKAIKKVKEIKITLDSRQDMLKKFDEDLFAKIVEQVRVISLVEVELSYNNEYVKKKYCR